MKNTFSFLLSVLFFMAALAPISSQINPDVINPNLPDVFAPPPANGPNLVISKLSITALSANFIKFSFDITNVGNQAANVDKVAAHASAKSIEKGIVDIGSTFLTGISSLAAGSTHRQSFSATLHTAGFYSLCLSIDYKNAVQETQEGDNDLCVACKNGASVTNTDLRAVPKFLNGNGLGVFRKATTPSLVYFQIRNNGPMPAPPTKTKVAYGKNGPENTWKAIVLSTPAIPAYGTVTLSFPFEKFHCHTHTIKIGIDNENVIKETNESNNIVYSQYCED
ncbi:MAG: hypothetical protein H6559_29835 [Lewinellaceae bacterium]|nr:hypothetical protein [Lewinellaceae bacterium]